MLTLLALIASADAADLLPPMTQGWEVTMDWASEGGWWVSPVTEFADGGDRAAMLATVDGPLWVEVRAVDGRVGPWVPLEETWRGGDGQRVLAGDLPGWAGAAQVRVWGVERVEALGWALHVTGLEARGADSGPAPVRPASVSDALRDIGVIPREDWGADPTNCTSYEDDWYRYAIHHTAGGQTSGGTVQGAVQGLQAYAFSTGSYCDIPYQFLVGYDGTLWEGRPLEFTSGATGGGNNDGNIAICFMGCYDSAYCDSGGGDVETLQMMAAARLLAQTLAGEHAAPTTEDSLRGHQEWPDNATACPGDRVLARLDEVRSASAHYEGVFVDDAWGGAVTVGLGETVTGWVDVRNDGMETWTGNTKLAPLPRDVGSELAGSGWESGTRVGPPEADVAPGGTGRFPLTITGGAEGSYALSLGLVEEWVAWFEDAPIGGGPDEGDIVLTVTVSEGDTTTPADTGLYTDSGDTGDVTGPGPGGPGSPGGPGGDLPGIGATFGERSALDGGKGCGCNAAPRGWSWLAALSGLGLLLLRRRATVAPFAM